MICFDSVKPPFSLLLFIFEGAIASRELRCAHLWITISIYIFYLSVRQKSFTHATFKHLAFIRENHERVADSHTRIHLPHPSISSCICLRNLADIHCMQCVCVRTGSAAV
uniref:Putative secreted protein n=1 Tax=Amblyomma cajennense TaxID=34607 RepID=A0A023FBT9_AMBCJ